MFENFFKSSGKNKKKSGKFTVFGKKDKTSNLPVNPDDISSDLDDVPDEEYQLPSLHRGDYRITDELLHRMEEEQLRKWYNISPVKSGVYL